MVGAGVWTLPGSGCAGLAGREAVPGLASGFRGFAGDDLVVVPVLGPVEGVAVLLGFFEVFDVHPGQEGV